MKRVACLCVILLCSISFAFAQSAKPSRANTNSKQIVKKPVIEPFAEAEKAWILFWDEFRKAVKNRDKNSLREMISKDFNMSGYNDPTECGNLLDKRDAYFCLLKERKTDLFKHLNWTLSKYTAIKKVENTGEEIIRTVEYNNPNEQVYFFADFEYEQGGHWYLIREGSGGGG